MLLSVIIPAFNEEKYIGPCLRAAFAACRAVSERDNFDFDVTVVDNNSTDRTAELARAEGARVVFEGKNQIARARNRGAEAVAGDWLLFLDADTTLSPEILAETVRAIRTGRVAGGGSLMRFPKDTPWFVRGGVAFFSFLSRTFHLAAGAYIFCRADLFREVGGFNEAFYVSEEIDFSRRMKRLARKHAKTFLILTSHPVLTSDRKARLYKPSEWLRFLFHCTFSPLRTVRDRDRCRFWYDGRR